jgi:hypothetical protein
MQALIRLLQSTVDVLAPLMAGLENQKQVEADCASDVSN